MKVEVSKIEETLKRAEHHAQPRHVRRRGDDSQRQGRHPRALRREGLQRRRRSTTTHDASCRAGRSWSSSTFNIDRARSARSRKSSSTATRRSPTSKLREPDEGQQAARAGCRSSPAAARTRKRSSRTTPRRCREFYQNHGYVRARSRPAADRDDRGLEGRQDALDPPARSGRRGRAVQDRHVRDRRQHGASSTEFLRPLFKIQEGDVLQPQEASGRASRRRKEVYGTRRLLAVHARRRSAFRAASTPRPGKPIGPEPPPPIIDLTMQDGRRQAVLRQPHHVPRQHDDARHRHPPRDARLTKAASSTPRRSRRASAG